MSEIQKFDPALLMQGVRERIKATFVSLIPDDQWAALCEKEIRKFFEPTKDRYNNYHQMSSFSMVCNEVLKDFSKEKLREFMKDYDAEIWNSITNQKEAPVLLKELLIKHAGEIFVATFSGMFNEAVQQLKRTY